MAKEGPDGSLELHEVIHQLRSEIVTAVDRADDDDPDLRFRLEKVQLELEVAVTRAAEGETKAKFWVLEFGAKGAVEKSRTQKVVLELTPRPGGEDESRDFIDLAG